MFKTVELSVLKKLDLIRRIKDKQEKERKEAVKIRQEEVRISSRDY
ncbi:MAG: hypothetical protein PHF46_01630 [Candidatus Gracilibacteria bacterium]|nr:hypothetical protein [Candidatus Gracilibacteria bacterium]MDD4530213.1 hypothetical protein [Candidatus Gracilibacteria bacterium]